MFQSEQVRRVSEFLCNYLSIYRNEDGKEEEEKRKSERGKKGGGKKQKRGGKEGGKKKGRQASKASRAPPTKLGTVT